MKNIDTAKIVAEIKNEQEKKNIKENSIVIFTPLLFDDEKLRGCIASLESSYHINLYSPIKGNKIKCFVKRAIRKIVRPIFINQAFQQEKFNKNTFDAINQLENYIKSLEKRIKELEQKRV